MTLINISQASFEANGDDAEVKISFVISGKDDVRRFRAICNPIPDNSFVNCLQLIIDAAREKYSP